MSVIIIVLLIVLMLLPSTDITVKTKYGVYNYNAQRFYRRNKTLLKFIKKKIFVH